MNAPITTEVEPKGMLDKIGASIAKHVLPQLVKLLWPLLTEYFTREVLPKVSGLIPLAVAAGIKEVAEKVPGMDAAIDAIALAEDVRDRINVAVPDWDIPIVSEVFDLTDWWNKGKR